MDEIRDRLKYYRKQNIKMLKELFIHKIQACTGLCTDLIDIIQKYADYYWDYSVELWNQDNNLDGYM